MKLYEISLELQMILDCEELDLDMEARLDELQWALEKKVQGCLEYRQGLEREAEAVAKEIDRLTHRRDALEHKAERLTDYIQHQLERCGVAKVKTPTLTATVCKAPPSVRIEGTDWLATPRYCNEKTVVTADKKAILEDHKAGQPLPAGVTVVQNTYLKVS